MQTLPHLILVLLNIHNTYNILLCYVFQMNKLCVKLSPYKVVSSGYKVDWKFSIHKPEVQSYFSAIKQ
jgi:hypothetical protein